MYYSVSAFGYQNSGIGVATSSNLEPGSWTDHGSIGIDSREGSPYNTIDANLVKSGNDYYLSFGSFWDDIFQVRMSSDLKRAATTPKNVIYTPVGVRAIEGPSVLQNGNYFYMFFSAGKCCGLDVDTPPAGEEYSKEHPLESRVIFVAPGAGSALDPSICRIKWNADCPTLK